MIRTRRLALRQAASVALAVVPFGLAFGVACTEAGLRPWEAAGFSAFVFSGSAQFAAVDIIGDGGTAVSAVVAGLLLNLRSIAFGVAMAPALAGALWKRAVWSQLMIDESTAVGSAQTTLADQRFGYLAAGVALFVTWNTSTLVGVLAFSSAGDVITDWGIDATIPAAFLALLWPRLRARDQRAAAAAGAAIALVLAPIAPAGVPIIAAGLGVVAGWRMSP
jgi:predicted branched-subunit amino acid permease